MNTITDKNQKSNTGASITNRTEKQITETKLVKTTTNFSLLTPIFEIIEHDSDSYILGYN